MQDILQRIHSSTISNLNNGVKASRAKSLGLTHVTYNTYRDKDYNYWIWDGNDFTKSKSIEKNDTKFNKFAKLNSLFAKDIGK